MQTDLTHPEEWTPTMLAVWGVAMEMFYGLPAPEYAELTYGQFQHLAARRLVEAAQVEALIPAGVQPIHPVEDAEPGSP